MVKRAARDPGAPDDFFGGGVGVAAIGE